MDTASLRRTSYLVDNVRFPFCKGCSHTNILRKLNDALVELQIPAERLALVTDIGCIGLADGLFRDIHTVHTTHGRSTAFACGIALADGILASGQLHIIVLIGDGGAMIGLQHLVHAAMLNVRMTVIICNNFVYGMTGGQGSGLTPDCFITATTPRGNLVPPADLGGILKHSNAPFVVRTTVSDPGLTGTLKEALASPGFSAVEVLELCTEYAVPKNELTGRRLSEIAQENGWELGKLAHREGIPFDQKVRQAPAGAAAESPNEPPARVEPSPLDRPVNLVIAGSAGERVQSSATALGQAAASAGCRVTQKNDNPVTQGSGFSLSEVWVSPYPIGFTGIEVPDVVVATSEDGWNELRRRGTVGSIGPDTIVILDDTLTPPERGSIVRLPLRKTVTGANAAMAGALIAAHRLDILTEATVRQLAARRLGGSAPAFERLLTPVPAPTS
ncbi:MAG: thiamine pyrophosphate-dependent enzyme [Bacteroidetes bacterium]|jgi:pyruvate/2-oxoacid:ferredoxin oxidoreductase beta subunit/Pyruvate/2-oxoacid:ferredoxin oxidoreductase gamma subunit|nr:thiamine pyrophosphate-dependent enzyme [Bacteroidota bacterium]